GVEDDVDAGRRQVMPKAAGEFGRGELQTQGEQQQHDADWRPRGDELTGGGHRQDAALTERKTGEQVHRYWRQRESSCQSAQYSERGQEGAELEQQRPRDLHGSGLIDDLFDPGDAFFGADDYQDIAG